MEIWSTQIGPNVYAAGLLLPRHFSEGVDAGMAAEYLPQIKEDKTQLSQVEQLDRRLT
jgi:hypothetical protein